MINSKKDKRSVGDLLIKTGVTMVSLILFPAIVQQLGVSPYVVNALKTALSTTEDM
ncbi:MAG: hypothetical protein HQL06_09450 [Nitrospirae bacterium]|nr:hypothetical protein [Nitrospirota bacterium]